MGLLAGLGLLAAAAIPDAARSYKTQLGVARAREKYGPENTAAYNMVQAIYYGLSSWDGQKCPVYTSETLALADKYKKEGRPCAYMCAVHDLAKRECEKAGIPFTGAYVNTFHLPGGIRNAYL